jgi:putative Holliday junction resolvase
MGVDVGAARIGVAISEGSLALAHNTLAATPTAPVELAGLATDRQVETIFVGLPLSLSGARTKSSELAIEFATLLAAETEARVKLVDERLTTVSSQRLLRQAGKNTRQAKSMIDAESARLILDFALGAPHATTALEDIDA